jgi:hypothetical protein
MKTKKTTKKVKVTNYKKLCEQLRKENAEIKTSYIELAKAANSFSHWAAALEASEKIRKASLEELPLYRNIIIKHDV